MRLRIQHLGPIQQAELDIRPLTVFVGHNHTGKTWAAYALYAVARSLARVSYSPTPRWFGIGRPTALDTAVHRATELLTSKLVGSSATEVRTRITREEIRAGLEEADQVFTIGAAGIASLLGIPESDFTGEAPQGALVISRSEFSASVFQAVEIVLSSSSKELTLSFRTDDEANPDTISVPLDGRSVSTNGAGLDQDYVKRLLQEIIDTLFYTLVSNATVLPAERKAILSIHPTHPGMLLHETNAGLPAPVYDFHRMISTAYRGSRIRRPGTDIFSRLADVLEEKILMGRVEFEDQEQIRKDTIGGFSTRWKSVSNVGTSNLLDYTTRGGVKLAIHASASVVRSLAGLDVYLKHFCEPRGILVIDEPEMNAHPDAQLKIIEFLAVLANHGVRVVITTHSPYIVDHLSNLMQASELSEKDRQAVAPRFKLGMPEAFLSPDQVATYLFNDDGTVEDILDRRLGIANIGTFGTPTEYMEGLAHGIWDLKDDEVAAAETRNAV